MFAVYALFPELCCVQIQCTHFSAQHDGNRPQFLFVFKSLRQTREGTNHGGAKREDKMFVYLQISPWWHTVPRWTCTTETTGMLANSRMSKTAAGITGDPYQGSSLSSGARASIFQNRPSIHFKRPYNNLQANKCINSWAQKLRRHLNSQKHLHYDYSWTRLFTRTHFKQSEDMLPSLLSH